MSSNEYLAKLKAIRKELGDGHRSLVSNYSSKAAGRDLPKIIDMYVQMEALDRMIDAEEARVG